MRGRDQSGLARKLTCRRPQSLADPDELALPDRRFRPRFDVLARCRLNLLFGSRQDPNCEVRSELLEDRAGSVLEAETVAGWFVDRSRDSNKRRFDGFISQTEFAMNGLGETIDERRGTVGHADHLTRILAGRESHVAIVERA
jgi:hypothetical protein